MKGYRNIIFLMVFLTLVILALSGCESNTVANFIISDKQYTVNSDLESAKQPEELTAGQDIYASVYFIESPKGMEYTARWFINGDEIKTDTQKLLTDRKGIIAFFLEGEKVTAGTLKFEAIYKDSILAEKELVIVEE